MAAALPARGGAGSACGRRAADRRRAGGGAGVRRGPAFDRRGRSCWGICPMAMRRRTSWRACRPASPSTAGPCGAT
ncbi:hypothetical protein AB5I41_11510 [Sphingomonas sp. MMS24-JH45]